jgi:hypothetical protein
VLFTPVVHDLRAISVVGNHSLMRKSEPWSLAEKIGIPLVAVTGAIGAILTAAAIRYSTDAALWDFILWGGVAVLLGSLVCLALIIFSHFNGLNFVIPAVLIFVGIGFIVVGVAYYLWPVSHNRIVESPSTQAQNRSKTPVTDIEMQTMRDVDNWIGVLDEAGLRNVFDLPGVLAHNLNFISNNKGPYDGHQAVAEMVIADLRKVSMYKEPDGRGRYSIPPGTVAVLFTTKAYEDAKLRLDQYARSAYLSDETRAAIKGLSDTVARNMSLMIDVLDREFKSNPETIIDYNTKDSPYFGAVANTYWSLYYPLRLAAENINKAIRARLSNQ